MIALLLAFVPAACHILHGDVITGRDLGEAVPALAALPADLQVGLAPIPGRQRTFTAAELKRIAAAQNIHPESLENVCFEWNLAVPGKQELVAAMHKSLGEREALIKVEEQSFSPAPQGDIVFPLAGLAVGTENAVIWRGYIEYAPGRRFSIWARVSVTVKEKRLVTNADLRAGEAIGPSQIELKTVEGPLTHSNFIVDPVKAVGMLARRTLPAGSTLTEEMLEAPMDVVSGETVTALVENGGARLLVQGIAESTGRRGQVISVRNPRSGRTFRARVEERGMVLLVPGGQYGLVPEKSKS